MFSKGVVSERPLSEESARLYTLLLSHIQMPRTDRHTLNRKLDFLPSILPLVTYVVTFYVYSQAMRDPGNIDNGASAVAESIEMAHRNTAIKSEALFTADKYADVMEAHSSDTAGMTGVSNGNHLSTIKDIKRESLEIDGGMGMHKQGRSQHVVHYCSHR